IDQVYYERNPGQIYHHDGNGVGLIASISKNSKMRCLAECANEPQCFNVNFKKGVLCEMYGLADAGWYEHHDTFDSYFAKSKPIVSKTTIQLPTTTTTTTTTTQSPTSATVPDCGSLGLVDLGVAGSCYYIEAIDRNVMDGLNICQSHSPPMSLVSIDDADEQNKIRAHLAGLNSPSWWNIGLNDFAVQGQYVWFATGAAPSWTNWHYGQPNAISDNCVIMSNENGEWYDVDCNFSYGTLGQFTICEYK
ncbi:unnamed protein product, partial [Owenia fusiformis]